MDILGSGCTNANDGPIWQMNIATFKNGTTSILSRSGTLLQGTSEDLTASLVRFFPLNLNHAIIPF
jgi:succinyl-CoA synthetase alpha subunit